MKRLSLAFVAVLLLTTGGLFAVDEVPVVGRAIATVKVWLIDGELAEDADPIVSVVQSGITGTHQIEGVKPKGGGPREYWTVTITKQDQPNPLPPLPVPPGPTPQPTLQGFALEVYQQTKVLPATDCRRLAANYETIATMIAAGGIRDMPTANAKLTELNKALSLSPATWSSFSQWYLIQLNRDAQTLEATRKLFTETAQGLNAAGMR